MKDLTNIFNEDFYIDIKNFTKEFNWDEFEGRKREIIIENITEYVSKPSLTIDMLLPTGLYNHVVDNLDLNILNEENLIYIFYNFPQTEIQYETLKILYRKYFYVYHIGKNMLIQDVEILKLRRQSGEAELFAFDPLCWDIVCINVTIDMNFFKNLYEL